MRPFAQSIVETVRQPLVILDLALRVHAVNPAFRTAFGISHEQVVGLLIFALEGGAWDIVGLREPLELVAATGKSCERFEVEQNFPGTGPKALRMNARRVVSEEDGSEMILLAIEEVTDKKRAEDALRQLTDELETRVQFRTTQLEAVNQEMEAFCYSVSHDLRAPLRAIDGFSQELLETYADRLDGQGRHYLKRVRASSQRMAELIDDLLQLSRLSRGDLKHQTVDLTALAETVAAELRQINPGRSITFTVQPGLTVRADAGLLRLALENLLGNAWKFTSKKPYATVEFGRQSDTPAEFFVRDDGAGFDPAFTNKLFGAFQRLHHERDFPGTGIGLATVHRVIRRHGGSVRAVGAIGQGATFYFTIPHEVRT